MKKIALAAFMLLCGVSFCFGKYNNIQDCYADCEIEFTRCAKSHLGHICEKKTKLCKRFCEMSKSN